MKTNKNYRPLPEYHAIGPSSIHGAGIFAKEDMYFIYQNNYNHFMNLYKNTYQHGGISMEEMLIPIITLKSK